MMETKEEQTVARQAATPIGTKGVASSQAPASVPNGFSNQAAASAPNVVKTLAAGSAPNPVRNKTTASAPNNASKQVLASAPNDVSDQAPAEAPKGKEGRKADEITLRVPNPLLVHQKPMLAKQAPPPVEPVSPHSSPTAKLKVSSLVWDEYNAMPLTPAPVTEDKILAGTSSATSQPKKRRGVMIALVVVIVGAGVLVGAFAPRNKTASPVEPLRPSETSSPITATPEKEATKPSALAVVAPAAPAAPARRHVSVTVEPAEATLALDGALQDGHAIALDVVQDGKPHIVQASAQGYLPFKKSFTLEGDVNLHISLKKAASPVFGSRPKARPVEPVAKPPVVVKPPVVIKPPESEPSVKPRVEPVEDFGMDLNRPAVRRQFKKMDEKDPYSP